MNIIFLNGRMVTADEARISVFDRGFLYGDGVFETVRIQSSKPIRWPAHEARLREGLRLLGFRLPSSGLDFDRSILDLLEANRCENGVLRVTVSRGVGVRGYSPAGAESPTVVMSLHPRPRESESPLLHLITSSVRILASDPLLRIKSASKLSHVLARAEADAAQADDALLLNHREEVCGVTSGNLFWLDDDMVCTPRLDCGVLPGVARGMVLELVEILGLKASETSANSAALLTAAGAFVTNAVTGVRQVGSVDRQDVRQSPVVERIRNTFETFVCAEMARKNPEA